MEGDSNRLKKMEEDSIAAEAFAPSSSTINFGSIVAKLENLSPPRPHIGTKKRFKHTMSLSDIQAVPATALLLLPDATINLGSAPDGNPLLLKVKRKETIGTTSTRLLEDRPDLQERYTSGLAEAQAALDEASLKTGMSADGRHFIPGIPVRKIVGDTLLSRIITASPREAVSKCLSTGAGRKREDPFHVYIPSVCYSPTYAPTSPAFAPASPAFAPASPSYPSHSKTKSPSHKKARLEEAAAKSRDTWIERQSESVLLSIPLGSDSSVMTRRGRVGTKREDEMEPFITESLHILAPKSIVSESGSQFESGYYTGSVEIFVDRRRLLLVLAHTCHVLNTKYHEVGIVHGDVTPANLLIMKDECTLIDAIGTPIGATAAGGTLEWSAPETLLHEPVTPSSDLFSVALMAVTLLEGMMHGEITEHVTSLRFKPSEPYELRSFKLIQKPRLTFNVAVTEQETLLAAVSADIGSRPAYSVLADALIKIAENLDVNDGWVPLRRAFGDGRLYKERSSSKVFWMCTDTW